MATATNNYDIETIRRKRLFGEEIPFEDETEETIVTPTPAGPVTAARMQEPLVKKRWYNEEGKLLNESEVSPETAKLPPDQIEIRKPSVALGRPEVQEAVKDFYSGREAAAGGDWIDLESPTAVMVRGQQAALDRAKEPTELQKKYKEMGLEYDYTKRAETGSVSIQDLDNEIEQENPAFVQRNREYNKVVNLRDQLEEQYKFQSGRLNAIEQDIWADPQYAGSKYGVNDMRLIRQQQAQLNSLYEAENAKLDGAFYDSLPDRDMEVANMLVNSGVTGKRMSTYTTNHGNIRDNINAITLNIPADKREEFTNRVMGDYVRDDQGNIVRNPLGDELRQGGDLVSLTPYGTYDFKLSPKVFAEGISKLAQEYLPKSQEDEIKILDRDISRLKEDLAMREDTDPEYSNLDSILKSKLTQRTEMILGLNKPTFEKQGNEPFISETETNVVTAPSTPTTAPTTAPSAPTKVASPNINNLIDSAIKKNYVKYDENGELTLASDSEQAKDVFERLKKINIK
jgi:hypothetical protein